MHDVLLIGTGDLFAESFGRSDGDGTTVATKLPLKTLLDTLCGQMMNIDEDKLNEGM